MKPWRNWYHCMASTYGHWLPGDPQGFRTRHHREHVEGDYKTPPPAGKYDERLAHSKSIMKRTPVVLPWNARVEACKRLVEALEYYKVELIDLCITATHFHVLARFSPFHETTQSPPTPVGGSPVPSQNPPTGVGGLCLPDEPRIITPALDWITLKQQIESAPGYFTDDDHAADQSPPTPMSGLSPAHYRKDGLDPRPRYLIGKAKSWCSRHIKSAGLISCQAGLFAKRGKIVPVTDRRHQLRAAEYIRNHIEEGAAVRSIHFKTNPPTGVGGL